MNEVKRSKCLYEGRVIGIESIFTVIDGKQINIPEKILDLRQKSHDKKLFCTCGCGNNLTLVAGPKSTRKQHFRLLKSFGTKECEYVEESEKSIISKVILKCWVEDKLKEEHIETRVPVCDLFDTDRRFEYTILAKGCNLAVSYCNVQENLSDEKIDFLKSHADEIKVLYVVDMSNYGSDDQWPEYLMKIQEAQGYCVFLEATDWGEFDQALVRVAYSYQNEIGLWKEHIVLEDNLFNHDITGNLVTYTDESIDALVEKSKHEIFAEVERKKDLLKAEEERKKEEERKRKEAWEKAVEQQRLEAEKRRLEAQEKSIKTPASVDASQRETKNTRDIIDSFGSINHAKLPTETKPIQNLDKKVEELKKKQDASVDEKMAAFEAFKRNSDFEQNEKPIIWTTGKQYKKCIICEKVLPVTSFTNSGDGKHINKGICENCIRVRRKKY